MDPLPLPSHIHYESLLQILEQQTLFAVGNNSPQRQQVQELIASLRKALSQQKRLESSCDRSQIPIDYRWSVHEQLPPAGQPQS
ncbi:MAG: DUF5340 domain-containing protein [Cyanobacteria bacterium P01_E01_bin.6]